MADYYNLNGKLCPTCILSFEGMRYNYHHQEYQDFITSKDVGCLLCTWLWDRHLPAPLEYQNGEKEFEFKISRLIVRGWDVYHTHFSIQCNWFPLAELKVSLCRQASYRNPEGSIPKNAQPWDDLNPYIGSDQTLQKLLGWISSCQESHEHCRYFHAGAEAFFPVRVIDVVDANSGIMFVKDREQVAIEHQRADCTTKWSYPDYWTLSHRWGNPDKIKQLLKITERRLREGISLNELSPTFRDAILLVSRLGYRYIWIDSLCIFQDSVSDWHREVGNLADIYRHSFCNISAISSSYNPATTGLFGRRNTDRRALYPITADIRLCDQSGDVSDGRWLIRNKSIWDYEIESAPLSRRGWVVQERFLARRLVHFTRNQIYWECLECTHCEAEPKTKLLALDRERVNQTGNWNYAYPKLIMAKIRKSSTAPSPRSLDDTFTYKSWRAIVSKYTSCSLTKESDKLAAISGIAKTYRDFNGDTYLAGLWKEKLYLHLLWKVSNENSGKTKRNGYAPSWSWASITGSKVGFVDIGKGYHSLIKFIDARIVTEPPGGDITGLLRSAELDIECALCSFLWSEDGVEIFNEESGETRNIPHDYTFLDTGKVKSYFGKIGACIPVCEWRSLTMRFTNFLLLEQVSENWFRRIGIESVRWNAPALPSCEKWASETSRITLI